MATFFLRHPLPLLCSLAACAFGLVLEAHAAAGAPPAKTRPALTSEQRSEAIRFAKVHHPELAELLSHLANRNEKEYVRAIRQLYITSDRLTRLEAREPARHALQLEQWKVDSRLRLLTARLAMGEDDSLRERIRELVEQRVENQRLQYEHERESLTKRLARIEAGIERIESGRESYVDRETKRIIGSVTRPKPVTSQPRKSGTVPTKATDEN